MFLAVFLILRMEQDQEVELELSCRVFILLDGEVPCEHGFVSGDRWFLWRLHRGGHGGGLGSVRRRRAGRLGAGDTYSKPHSVGAVSEDADTRAGFSK